MNGRHIEIPYLNNQAIEQKAQEFLRNTNIHSFPIDVDEVCDQLGVGIVQIPKLKPLLSVDAFITGDFNTIYVDEGCADITKNDCRYRFNIAHELGHKVLHSGHYPADIQDMDTYYAYAGSFDSNYASAERQANAFAGMILCPSIEVRNLAIKTFGCSLEDLVLKCNRTECEDFMDSMCKTFGISSKTALIRLRNILGDDFLLSLL